MEKILRFIQGYVRLRLNGREPERFLNLCAARGIRVSAVLPGKSGYELFLSLKDFFRLQPIARKTGSRVRVLEKHGLPFFFRRNRKRKAFFLGACLCLFLLFLLSRYIWNIHVEGNHANSTWTILEYLDTIGVRHGMARSRVDCQEIASSIREEFPNVTWVSARIRGTRLLVDIKENVDGYPAGDQETGGAPSDLVAEKDGTVERILTRSGTPLVEAGDVCRAGDVLVSGQVPIVNDSGETVRYEPVRADADIFIRSEMYYYQEFPLKHTVRTYLEKTEKRPFFELFGWRLDPSGREDENCDYVVREHQVFLTENFALPILYGTVESLPYREETEVYTAEEADELAEDRLRADMEDLEKTGVEILENHVKIEISDTVCRASGFFTVLDRSVREAPSAAPDITGKEEN